MTNRTIRTMEGGTQTMMTTIDESMTVMLLAKMLVENGKISEIVYVSELSAQIILDLLQIELVSSLMISSEAQNESSFMMTFLLRLWQILSDQSRFASAKQNDLKNRPIAKSTVRRIMLLTCFWLYSSSLIQVLTQQLQQLERQLTTISETKKIRCLQDLQQRRKVDQETTLFSSILSSSSILYSFSAEYCFFLPLCLSFYNAIAVSIQNTNLSISGLNSILFTFSGLNVKLAQWTLTVILLFVTSVKLSLQSAKSSLSLRKTVQFLSNWLKIPFTRPLILFFTIACVLESKLFKLVFMTMISPRLNARTRLILSFQPPEQLLVLVDKGMSAHLKSSISRKILSFQSCYSEVALSYILKVSKGDALSQLFSYTNPFLTLSSNKNTSLSRNASANAPCTENMLPFGSSILGKCIDFTSQIPTTFGCQRFRCNGSEIMYDFSPSIILLAVILLPLSVEISIFISSIALQAVFIPAIYQERAFRGKFNIPSRQMKVLGVKTDSLSRFWLRPSKKQAVITMLLMPTLVNCQRATHQQSSILTFLSPLWN